MNGGYRLTPATPAQSKSMKRTSTTSRGPGPNGFSSDSFLPTARTLHQDSGTLLPMQTQVPFAHNQATTRTCIKAAVDALVSDGIKQLQQTTTTHRAPNKERACDRLLAGTLNSTTTPSNTQFLTRGRQELTRSSIKHLELRSLPTKLHLGLVDRRDSHCSMTF